MVTTIDAATRLPTVDLSGFDTTTGLGEVVIGLDTPGRHEVGLFADLEIDATFNSLSNETGEARGVAAPGQSWEIDEPSLGGGGYFGDIYQNFLAHALDQLILENRADGTTQTLLEDIALAMGWELDIGPLEAVRIRFLLSLTQPTDGFYIVHRDPDSDVSVYLSARLQRIVGEPEFDVPAPASALLLASAVALLTRARRVGRV